MSVNLGYMLHRKHVCEVETCKVVFYDASGMSRYCPKCAPVKYLERHRDYMRRKRAKAKEKKKHAEQSTAKA